MNRRDLRSSEAEWRNDPNRSAQRRTPYRRPQPRCWLRRMIDRLLNVRR